MIKLHDVISTLAMCVITILEFGMFSVWCYILGDVVCNCIGKVFNVSVDSNVGKAIIGLTVAYILIALGVM